MKTLTQKENQRNIMSFTYGNEKRYRYKLSKSPNKLNSDAKFKYKYAPQLFGKIYPKKNSVYIYLMIFFHILFMVLMPQINSLKKAELRNLSYLLGVR